MKLLQPRARDVGINLSGGQIAVPQEHLHRSQVRAMIEQVRRKCMAQRVRRNGSCHPCLTRVQFNTMPEGLTRHQVATPARKNNVAGLAGK